jgi:hypothetical protein
MKVAWTEYEVRSNGVVNGGCVLLDMLELCLLAPPRRSVLFGGISCEQSTVDIERSMLYGVPNNPEVNLDCKFLYEPR